MSIGDFDFEAYDVEEEPEIKKPQKQPEKILNDLYIVEKEIARGGFGIVYKCLNKETGEKVAIKEIFKKEGKNLDMVLNEIKIGLLLSDCKYIVKMKGTFDNTYNHYIIFEYSEIGDLYYEIERKVNENKAYMRYKHFIPNDQVKNIIRDLCLALKCCHEKNICHNDIKPENILIFKENGEYIYKLCDLGLSSVNKDKKEKINVGTKRFLAPEIWNQDDAYCDKSDLWAVGIILYHLLTFEFIFSDVKHKFLSEIQYPSIRFSEQNNISKDAKNLILGLLKIDPNERLTIDQILDHPFMK